jgi:hypothetical protein
VTTDQSRQECNGASDPGTGIYQFIMQTTINARKRLTALNGTNIRARAQPK